MRGRGRPLKKDPSCEQLAERARQRARYERKLATDAGLLKQLQDLSDELATKRKARALINIT